MVLWLNCGCDPCRHMKKILRLLKSILGWTFLAGMIVSSLFVLAAIIVNRHPLAEGLGVASVLCAFLSVVVMLCLFIRWMCRSYGTRSTAIVFGGFAILIGLFYAEEDFRGWHAWQKFKQQSEVKGENLDFASIVPPPVPDDQNFALTSIVASSYEDQLDRHGHRISPPKTSVVNRLRMKIYRDSDWEKQPTNGYWAKGTFTDLKDWQVYFRFPTTNKTTYFVNGLRNGPGMMTNEVTVTNEFPVPATPQFPAADVLFALGKFDSNIEELRLASHLPYSRFPIDYNSTNPFASLLLHLGSMKYCAQTLQLRALAELELGEPAKALDDIKLAFRLIDSSRQEPFLITHLVRIAELQIALQPIYQGLARHQWSDGELVEMQNELAKLDFLADCQRSMRGERNASIAAIDYWRKDFRAYQTLMEFELTGLQGEDKGVRWGDLLGATFYRFIPSGWFFLNEMNIGELHQRWTLQTVDPSKHLILPQIAKAGDDSWTNFHRRPWNMFAAMLMPALTACEQKFGYAQSAVDMAQVACALERYRLAQGQYPESLSALTPQYIDPLPNDVVGGQPLYYHRTDDGRFVLYSVGWNKTDDGGKIALTTGGRPDNKNGDWVWEYPAK